MKYISSLKFAFVGIALVAMLAVFSVYRLGDRMMLWSFVLFFLICMRAFLSCRGLLNFNQRETFVFFAGWFFVYLISIGVNSSIPDGTSWIYLIYATMFLMLRRDIQFEICTCFVKVLAVILAAAIVEFAIYQATGVGIVLGSVVRPEIQEFEMFNHLILNMVSEKYDIVRFQSLANEPGLLGTLCGLLLFSTGRIKSLRYPFFVFLVSGLLTYSLAFFILAAIYFISISKNLKKIIPVILVALVALYFVQDNFNELIIQRLESGDADNRSSWTMNLYFAKAFLNGDLYFGLGAHNFPIEITGSNAGAKVWIIQFGIVGLVIVFAAYIITYLSRRTTKLQLIDYAFLFAFWASFYQRQTIIDSYTILAFMLMPLVANQLNLTND